MKLTTILAVLMFLVVTPANAEFKAQPFECYPTELWLATIKGYGEELAAVGFAGKNEDHIMQVWANSETGSWTVLYIEGDEACSGASGWDFKIK